MKKEDDIAEKKGLGAKLNGDDTRDIPIAKIALGIDTAIHPSKNITDISNLPVEDQEDKGTCVGQAEGKGEEEREYRENGVVVRLSKKFIYKQCKLIDGLDAEGTYPRIAAQILFQKGAVKESLVPDTNSVPYAEYMKADVESSMILTDASSKRVKGYSFPYSLDDVKTGIDIAKTVNASHQVGDWNTLPVKPTYANGTNRGWHRVTWYGYEDSKNGKIDDTKIYFRNSWGLNWGKGKTTADKNLLKNGNGWFWWSEYSAYVQDMIAYVDMPNEIIDYAKSLVYVFTRDLEKGDQGTDVIELQKRLATEPAKDGLMCFRGGAYDVNFGPLTEQAVQRYQLVKGIVSRGTPSTTGYGRVGPKTRETLNGGNIPPALYPQVQQKRDLLITLMEAVGNPVKVTDEFRSVAEQDDLYAQGRTRPGAIVTNAKGGDSFHNWRCAFDVAFVKGNGISYDGPWEMLGKVGEAIGLEWGGRWTGFTDKPHFQFSAGYALEDFKAGRVDDGKFGIQSAIIKGSETYSLIKNFMISKRVKSFLISFVSVLVPALIAVVATPKFSVVAGDFLNYIQSLGVPASVAVVVGLLIAEVWKGILNKRIINDSKEKIASIGQTNSIVIRDLY